MHIAATVDAVMSTVVRCWLFSVLLDVPVVVVVDVCVHVFDDYYNNGGVDVSIFNIRPLQLYAIGVVIVSITRPSRIVVAVAGATVTVTAATFAAVTAVSTTIRLWSLAGDQATMLTY